MGMEGIYHAVFFIMELMNCREYPVDGWYTLLTDVAGTPLVPVLLGNQVLGDTACHLQYKHSGGRLAVVGSLPGPRCQRDKCICRARPRAIAFNDAGRRKSQLLIKD